MELTNELKEQYFSLYINQDVLKQKGKPNAGFNVFQTLATHISRGTFDELYLELRPLSSITEEEFKVMVRRNYPKDVDDIFFDKQFICDLFEDKEHLEHDSLRIGMVIFDVDYLRSIRIAIPFMGIPVSQWIEWGVVKLKEA